ncbi:hypothetical protein SCOCK_640033 [Actinacidiphila cocklensis]|uniref:Uncharacterized protein n=1 Tax=Actinacidiphila cocklensis TaxID=887465 RepID=A0A9W4DXA4_9ACTN|nr:hypothetical protein SCOCK_640033 [Actinacidiphila cocklensis]
MESPVARARGVGDVKDGGRREKHRRRFGDRRPVSDPGGAGPRHGAGGGGDGTRRRPRARGDRLPRPHGLCGHRHHLPAAGLLGAYGPGRTQRPPRLRFGHPAAVQLPRRGRPQDRQAAPRHRCLAAEHPHGGTPSAFGRPGRAGQDDPDERRRHGLRVRFARRGRRPAPGRPGGLRYRGGRRLAGRRGLAVRAAR